MDAHRLKKAGDWVFDGCYELQLPFVECSLCSPVIESWGDGGFEFPSFRFDFLAKKGVCMKGGQYRRTVVTLEKFQQLKKQIEEAAGRPVNIYPGSSIGKLSGTVCRKKLDDFVWGLRIPQISRRAVEIFASEGIELMTANCSLRYRGKEIDTHQALQIEPVAMMTKESLNRHKIFHCPRCGNFQSPPKPDPIVPEGYQFDRSKWPHNQHLVLMAETLDMIVSEKFISAVTKHKLTGLDFEKCGIFF